MNIKTFLTIASVLLLKNLFGQAPDSHKPGSFIGEDGKYFMQAELPVYIHISTSPEGNAHNLIPENPANEPKPIYLDGHGKHYLKHQEGNEKRSDVFPIYADGIAPITSIGFKEAVIFERGKEKTYFSKDLKVIFEPTDEMSGVEGTFFSVNGSNFSRYSDKIEFEENDYQVKYYSVDKVGNVENVHAVNFTIDATPPKINHLITGITGNNVIATSSVVSLSAEDKSSGVDKLYYQFDKGEWHEYKGGALPIAQLEEGNHTLTYYATDHVKNEAPLQSVFFFLDKSAPILSADILGDKYIAEGQVYFSGRTKLKLTAVDNKAGINEVKYSIDGSEYMTYTDPFYLPEVPGKHEIKYFGIDRIGNRGVGGTNPVAYGEYHHNVGTVYVDLDGPVLSYDIHGPKFIMRDTIYLQPESKVELKGRDSESGLNRISYAVNGQDNDLLYEKELSFEEGEFYSIRFAGYDEVNNRNETEFSFILDHEGPEIEVDFSITPRTVNEIPVIPSMATVFLSATDQKTGTSEIYYQLNGGKEELYRGKIKGFIADNEYELIIRAIDNLGNSSTHTVKFRTEPDISSTR